MQLDMHYTICRAPICIYLNEGVLHQLETHSAAAATRYLTVFVADPGANRIPTINLKSSSIILIPKMVMYKIITIIHHLSTALELILPPIHDSASVVDLRRFLSKPKTILASAYKVLVVSHRGKRFW